MKKTFQYILIGLALTAVMSGCNKTDTPAVNPDDVVDLRYSVESEYNLDAISPKPFEIKVKSSQPWTIVSSHPDWCIISEEEGEAQPADSVHIGHGETTKVKVQYYDNPYLDDRLDTITIASHGYVGKRVFVYQKGIAYLNVPEADIEGGLMIEKAGGDLVINVKSNQKWTAEVVPEGDGKTDWLSISEGASGELDGTVTVTVKENSGEKRYANLAVYDRHGEERALVFITQDGVQLDPETFEIRVGYDQLSASLSVVSNTKWMAEKGGTEDWYSIDNPDGHSGDGVLTVTLKDNSAGTSMRKGSITLKTIPANPGDPVAQKEIVVKQAYPIKAVRHLMDNDEISLWKSDWANPPAYTKDYGTLFAAKCRLNQGDMPFGTYTFRWKDWQGGARIRHWFCFSRSAELKVDIRPIDSKISFDFNAPDGDSAQKPAIESSYSSIDWGNPIEVTIKFDPSGAEYCHVTYLYNGVEMVSFDTSASTMCTTTWGAKINMYIGCDQVSGQDPGSGVLEWYEYTPPMDWDE